MSAGTLDRLAQDFAAHHPAEAALELAELPPTTAAAFLEACPHELAAAIAERMPSQDWVACLLCMSQSNAAAVLTAIPTERAASAMRRISELDRKAIIEHFPAGPKRRLRSLLGYEEGTAGSLMEPAVMAVQAGLTAGRALEQIARHADQVRYYVYVIDPSERLVGVIDLRRLMAADRGVLIESLMTSDLHRLSAHARRQAILEHPGWEEVHSLPVVGKNDTLLGVLRYESMRRLAERKAPRFEAPSPTAALAELYVSGSQRVLAELVILATRRSS